MSPRGVRLLTYASRVAMVRTAGAFALLLGTYVLIDAVESASAAGVSLARVASLYPLKLPLVAAHVAPVAAALGAVLALGALKRAGEWDAAAAAGVGPTSLLAGLAVLPIAFAVAAVPLVRVGAPRSLARYEAGTFAPAVRASAAARWIRDGARVVQVRGDGANQTRVAVELERGADGRVIAWLGPCGVGDARCAWRRDTGWSRSGATKEAAPIGAIATAPAPSAYGLVGASLTSAELSALADRIEAQGQPASGLRAEAALRTAVAAACAVVPALALLLAMAFGTTRAARLVGLGLGATAAYWIALSLAWNGALGGALSPRWVDLGVPLVFAAAIAASALPRGIAGRT